MKQFRFWHRIILTCGSLFLILTGLVLLLPAVLPMLSFVKVDMDAILLSKWTKLGLMLMGVVDILFAMYLFTIPHKFVIRRKDFVIQQTENGELRIAVVAIKNLVKKCVDMHEEVSLSHMRIHNSRGGVTVDLSISLANNIIIPLAVSSLQKKIKQYLQASSGIEVKEVRVAVETAKEAANNSPYMVKDDAAAEAELPTKEKKQPIHQRLFKRDDAQPAPLPEAPEAEQPETIETPAAEETPAEEIETPVEENTENAVQAQEEENNE